MADFSGKFKLTSTENFDEYMKDLGVGLAMRKMAGTAKPVQEIIQNGDDFTIKTSTTFKNTEIKFTLGKEFDETTADGRKVKSTVTKDGNKLICDQKGEKPSVLIREFNNGEMVMTLKSGDVVCTRVYKKE